MLIPGKAEHRYCSPPIPAARAPGQQWMQEEPAELPSGPRRAPATEHAGNRPPSWALEAHPAPARHSRLQPGPHPTPGAPAPHPAGTWLCRPGGARRRHCPRRCWTTLSPCRRREPPAAASRAGCRSPAGARRCSSTPWTPWGAAGESRAPVTPGWGLGAAPAPPRFTPRPTHLLGRPQDAALPVDLLVERVVEEGGRLRHPTEELVGRRQPRPPRAALRGRAGSRRALVGLGLFGLRIGAGAAVGREIAQRVLPLRRHGGAAPRTARGNRARAEGSGPRLLRPGPAGAASGGSGGAAPPGRAGSGRSRGAALQVTRHRKSPTKPSHPSFLLLHFHTGRPKWRENTFPLISDQRLT